MFLTVSAKQYVNVLLCSKLQFWGLGMTRRVEKVKKKIGLFREIQGKWTCTLEVVNEATAKSR